MYGSTPPIDVDLLPADRGPLIDARRRWKRKGFDAGVVGGKDGPIDLIDCWSSKGSPRYCPCREQTSMVPTWHCSYEFGAVHRSEG